MMERVVMRKVIVVSFFASVCFRGDASQCNTCQYNQSGWLSHSFVAKGSYGRSRVPLPEEYWNSPESYARNVPKSLCSPQTTVVEEQPTFTVVSDYIIDKEVESLQSQRNRVIRIRELPTVKSVTDLDAQNLNKRETEVLFTFLNQQTDLQYIGLLNCVNMSLRDVLEAIERKPGLTKLWITDTKGVSCITTHSYLYFIKELLNKKIMIPLYLRSVLVAPKILDTLGDAWNAFVEHSIDLEVFKKELLMAEKLVEIGEDEYDPSSEGSLFRKRMERIIEQSEASEQRNRWTYESVDSLDSTSSQEVINSLEETKTSASQSSSSSGASLSHGDSISSHSSGSSSTSSRWDAEKTEDDLFEFEETTQATANVNGEYPDWMNEYF